MLSPLVMLLVFGVVMHQRIGALDVGAFSMTGGLALATFASSICLMSILPIAMNQFAVDGAGLTMVLLSPLEDREYLAGKAVGNALMTGPSTLICILGSLVVFPGGSPAMWLALVVGLVAVYLLVAPIAAMCSAIFPRVVNLNSIGRGSNAHGMSGLIGLLSFVAAAAPCVLLLGAARLLHRPSLTPVFLAVWCGMAYGISRLLFMPALRIYGTRRQNLAMLRTTGSTQ